MHDKIKDMGRQIIFYENRVDPGSRSRLWNHDDIQGVLQNRKGTSNIQGITLDFYKRRRAGVLSAQTISWYKLKSNPSVVSALSYLKEMFKDYCKHKEEGDMVFFTKSFKPMVHLRLLHISNVTLEGDFTQFPAGLKWLQWRKCPLECLDYCPQELTVLDLTESKLKNIWGKQRWYWYNKKVKGKLMVLNLRSCYKLNAIPDLSGHPNLEKLILEGCIGLTRIHKSGSAADCIALEVISDLSNLEHLTDLDLSNCEKLIDIPGFECLKSLTRLHMCGCSLCSPAALRKLRNLSVPGCDLPHWLKQKVVHFSERKNLEIRGIIIRIVVSVDHHIQNDIMGKMVGIFGCLLIMGLDTIAGVLGIRAEAAQNQVNHLRLWIFECKEPSHEAFKLGFAAAVLLVLAHVLAHLFSGCTVCFGEDTEKASTNRQLSLACLLFTWITMAGAMSMLVIGTSSNRKSRASCSFIPPFSINWRDSLHGSWSLLCHLLCYCHCCSH